jgi:3',5'-cyclic AMP phosphodiesterase CpdA
MTPPRGPSRRAFLGGLVATAATTIVRLPVRARTVGPAVRFGVITDVHQDIIHDGPARVGAFARAMTAARADFVIQLGDFCIPREANREFLAAWTAFAGPRRHVLGNHDMDGGYSREQAAAFLGMPARHYTFDAGPFIGIVLDGNDPGGMAGAYARFIASEQLAWLEATLASAAKPVIAFTHQPLDDEFGVENGAEVRGVLERAEAKHPGRVLATFAGHLHVDYLRVLGGLPYVQINSASYYWLGEAGASLDLFPAQVHEQHPSLRYVAAYRDPLWALVEVDLTAGEIRLQGRESRWIGPPALERAALRERGNREHVRPAIGDRRISRAGRALPS